MKRANDSYNYQINGGKKDVCREFFFHPHWMQKLSLRIFLPPAILCKNYRFFFYVLCKGLLVCISDSSYRYKHICFKPIWPKETYNQHREGELHRFQTGASRCSAT